MDRDYAGNNKDEDTVMVTWTWYITGQKKTSVSKGWAENCKCTEKAREQRIGCWGQQHRKEESGLGQKASEMDMCKKRKRGNRDQNL